MCPPDAPEPHAPPALCGAKKKRGGGTCSQPAGVRTDHPGQGKCWLHGGRTPVKHGRYSDIRRPRVAALYQAHRDGDAPLDTTPEVALMRALTQDYVERYDATMEALVAWHESWRARIELVTPEQARALLRVLDEYEEEHEGGDGLTERQRADLNMARAATERLRDGDPDAPPPAKPVQLPDVADAVKLLAEVSKAVERVERSRAAETLSYDQLKRFLFGLDRVLVARVTDAALLARLRDDILGIGL